MPEQEHTTEKEPYIGSVRFFKNLILLLVIVLITIPTAAAVCLYHSGRDVKEQLRLLQEGDTAQARYSTDEMSGEVNAPLSYQKLYPDFYAEEPAPAQVTREKCDTFATEKVARRSASIERKLKGVSEIRLVELIFR